MKRALILLPLALAACGAVQPPQTPAQAIVEAYAGLGSAVSAFNTYAGQRPFCGDPGARPAPLCADRAVVIEGDKRANQVADALDIASAAIRSTNAQDQQWKALTDPMTLLQGFREFVRQKAGG